jgi:hypothetical protein
MYSALRIDCCFCGSSVVIYSPSGFRNKFHLTPAAGIPTPVSTASRARIVKHVKILYIFLLMYVKRMHMGEVMVCGSLHISRLQTVGHAKVVLHIGFH